ncbi:ADP-dependent NAD(P)H-hydrate dehydratase [Georgenia sp. SUBG003]|uniref:ADP-dependent NAD(P)H-hydrate dehydratase n=1 Tax=Georgenia sp. SUBG003 TaxID=1497974 RepID=UPI003AB68711
MGEPEGTLALLRGLVPHVAEEAVVVLDAFALGVLPGAGDVQDRLRGRLVLTPNLAETARLLEREEIPDEDAADAVRDAAARFGAVVCGHGFVSDGERTWRSSTGHTGLGTSGSGDVLAGAIVGLLARGADPAQAAVWAMHLHAAAGDALTARVGKVGFLARELVDELPHQLHALTA